MLKKSFQSASVRLKDKINAFYQQCTDLLINALKLKKHVKKVITSFTNTLHLAKTIYPAVQI